MRIAAIVNPHAASGRAARILPQLRRALIDITDQAHVCLTTGPGSAPRLTQQALEQGATHVIAVGGDGTTHEVVNGMWRTTGGAMSGVTLGVVGIGTGADFTRSLAPSSSLVDAVRAAVLGLPRPIDLGIVTSPTRPDEAFVNVASAGLSAHVAARVNATPRIKRWLGALAYTPAALAAVLAARPVRVRLSLDGGPPNLLDVVLVAVCNGSHFGGGLRIAPGADVSDGLFDVVVVEQRSRARLMAALYSLQRGTHLDLPFVRHTRARRVDVAVEGGATLAGECDGEVCPPFPRVTLTVLPGALSLRR